MRIGMLAYAQYESDTRIRQYAEVLAKRGETVDVISLRKKGQPSFAILNDVNVFRIQERTRDESGKFDYLFRVLKFFIKSSFTISRMHIKNRYQVIHVHSVPDSEVFAALLPRLFGAKIILDIHDIVPEFYANKFQARWNSILIKLLLFIEKISIAFSNHVIIANHLWQKRLISRSVKEEKCTAFLNYPNPSIFYKREVNRRDNKFIILYPGTLNKHQGLDIAIKAIAIIKDKIPNLEFHIYGEGNEKDALITMVSNNGLSDRVFFKDHLPLEEVAEKMAHADIGVVPKRADSFGNEAFSTKILQFMALGVPVIVSNTKIDKYYFDDSLVTFFRSNDEYDLAKCIVELYENQSLRNEKVIKALRFIQSNNLETKKKVYLDLIDSLVNTDKQKISF